MKRSRVHKHIYKTNNSYAIVKSINNKRKFFKSFNNIDEAIKYRDRLITNDWKPLPETPEEKLEKLQKEYYIHIGGSSKKHGYIARTKKDEYIGYFTTIEEALYARDLYLNTPREEIPSGPTIDAVTNNPYIRDGLKYPLPERLKKITPRTNGYGFGTIVKKGETSFHIHHGAKNKGWKSYVCSCPTYEMAEYVRMEMNKCNWDKSQLQRIIDDYPRYYTKLLYFYQHINKNINYQTGEWNGRYKLQFPIRYTEKLEYITYKNIEDALFERDFLKAHEWDYDLLVETINDEENPYYNMTLPPYPTRKIRNIRDRNYHEEELIAVIELIKEGHDNQVEICKLLEINDINLRNWLKLWNTNFKEFKELIYNGENPLEVLEKQELIYQPDLSHALPNNYNGYVHAMANGNFNVSRKNVYYGTYPSEKLARNIVRDLVKCNWDKSKLKDIQSKHGYTSPVMSKKWVYSHGPNKWAVRRKNKDKRMITYGSYYDKRIACLVRDLLIEYGWNVDFMTWIDEIAFWTIKMVDLRTGTMFGKTTLEDISHCNPIENNEVNYYHYAHGKWQVSRRVNNDFVYYGRFDTEEKAKEVVEFLKNNNWNKELLKIMLEIGEF